MAPGMKGLAWTRSTVSFKMLLEKGKVVFAPAPTLPQNLPPSSTFSFCPVRPPDCPRPGPLGYLWAEDDSSE